MIVYDVIVEMKKSPNFSLLLKSGVIPISVVSRLHYYQTYLRLLEEHKSIMTATQLAADDCGVGTTTIYNARRFFESKI